ncbi:MAG: hypothetical protein JSW39_18180, partial [Desulfobacterales bacterium]
MASMRAVNQLKPRTLFSHPHYGLSDQPLEPPPLVVDLDGTLIKTDVLVESFWALFTQNPLYIFVLPFWGLKGKAYLKEQISQRVALDVSV